MKKKKPFDCREYHIDCICSHCAKFLCAVAACQKCEAVSSIFPIFECVGFREDVNNHVIQGTFGKND